MYQINLSEEEIILKEEYNLISCTTSVKNRKGEIKKYTAHNCSFPYPFYEMLDYSKKLYVYERLGQTYITNEEPPNYYFYKKVSLQNRKNEKQKSSKENENKKWAKLITIPKDIFGDLTYYKTLTYKLHCNKKDYVTDRQGLLEIKIS